MTEKLTRPETVLEELFNRAIVSGRELQDVATRGDTKKTFDLFEMWDKNAQQLLSGAFTGSEPSKVYPKDFSRSRFTMPGTSALDVDRIREGIGFRLMALQTIKDMLGLYEEPAETILVGQEHPASRTSTAVFIVHGRAEGPKQQVARFLERSTNAQPIILHEQPKRGQVIIETLEAYAAKAAFSIVLLTADDRGSLANSQESHSRARQNVVFELGFFIGALGRSRVAVLYEEGVERPSDMNGILYTVLDFQGTWKLSLGRELRAAGFAVDLNLAR